MAVLVQILNETVCISHSTNTLGKGMNSSILLPASSLSIVIDEDHLVNLMIEEGICECADG